MLPDIQYFFLNSKIQFSFKFNRKASNSPPSTAPLARVSLALEPAEASVNPGGITESPTRGRNPLTEDEQRVVAAQNTRAKINEGIFSLAHMGHRDEKVRKVDTKQHTHTTLDLFASFRHSGPVVELECWPKRVLALFAYANTAH